MIITFLCGIAIVLLIGSLTKTSQLQKEYFEIQKRVRELKDTVDANRRYLRQKLNRNLILQKNVANESIPTVTYQKLEKRVQVLLPSDNIYTLAEDEGFGLFGTCEGNGDCGLCAISIVSGAENLSPLSRVEQKILEKLVYPSGTRLSCQARIQGDVVVNFLDAEGQA